MADSAPPITVRDLEANDNARWDAFVDATPGGTFFHLSGWKRVIEGAFKHLLRDFAGTRMDRLFLGEASGPFPLVPAWMDL